MAAGLKLAQIASKTQIKRGYKRNFKENQICLNLLPNMNNGIARGLQYGWKNFFKTDCTFLLNLTTNIDVRQWCFNTNKKEKWTMRKNNRVIHETQTETLFYCSGIDALVNKETRGIKPLNISDAAFWMLHNSTLVEFEREFWLLSDAAKELFFLIH